MIPYYFSGLLLAALWSPSQEIRSIEVGGMSIDWQETADAWIFTLTAPTDGWVALGFNEQNNIVHANLIMGAMKNGEVVFEDQYVVGAGLHPMIETLGGTAAIYGLWGKEATGRTTVGFSIPKVSNDGFHKNLSAGSQVWLICAYSVSDDFDHHSRMREHVRVKL
ncbi:MAG: hypothetical protein DHS20C18_30170 [Saprospiraceae bacterium]|nr:MAG: hypothetical protein DHS20C18_30170 [Saprospiraceae bacterium]